MTNLTGMVVGANLFYGIESVGGKLIFTERSLIFKPHLANVHHKSTEIAYDQISDVRKKSTLGIVPNGILVVTRDENSYKFVVNGRDAIIEFLNNKKS
jgi:hypothetical protein